MYSLKYLKSTTFGSKAIVIRKSEFEAKTHLFCNSTPMKTENDKTMAKTITRTSGRG